MSARAYGDTNATVRRFNAGKYPSVNASAGSTKSTTRSSHIRMAALCSRTCISSDTNALHNSPKGSARQRNEEPDASHRSPPWRVRLFSCKKCPQTLWKSKTAIGSHCLHLESDVSQLANDAGGIEQRKPVRLCVAAKELASSAER